MTSDLVRMLRDYAIHGDDRFAAARFNQAADRIEVLKIDNEKKREVNVALFDEIVANRARIEELERALRGCLAVIRRDYYDQRAAALEGHIIAYDARKEWDQGWAALCEQPPEAK